MVRDKGKKDRITQMKEIIHARRTLPQSHWLGK